MGIVYQDDLTTIYHGDCLEILPSLTGISAVVTDPPYELGFMGKSWDKKGISFQVDTWRLILESCLPGAMLLSFGGTRTSHRIACAIEDAGWQIKDTIMWVYGSGFPKSLDISKAIDKQRGAKREVIGKYQHPDGSGERRAKGLPMINTATPRKENGEWNYNVTAPATPEAKLWEGYGTALKPAYEPIIVAMKTLDGTFANNALKHKVAGLNIDECRIPSEPELDKNWTERKAHGGFRQTGTTGIFGSGKTNKDFSYHKLKQGRFPANFIYDGSQEVMELFPQVKTGNIDGTYNNTIMANRRGQRDGKPIHLQFKGDSGSAARFFYTAKASRSERDAGLEDIHALSEWEGKHGLTSQWCIICGKRQDSCKCAKPQWEKRINPTTGFRNNHPTVKPLALMTYLCKLVKMPEYNLILDPFCGSGSTLLACRKLGIKAIGIDSNEQYCEIAAKRYDANRGKEETISA